MRSVFSRLSADNLRTDPFPHLVADDVLPVDLYRELSDGFPPFSVIAWDGSPPNNKRYPLSAHLALGNDRIPAVWRDFLQLHSSPAILAEVDALLGPHWDPAMLRCLDGHVRGHEYGLYGRDRAEPGCVLQDARLEINTPVSMTPGTPRGPHLDTQNRLFTGLFYMRDPADRSEGGDLLLYRWRAAIPPRIDVFAFPDDLVEAVATIPYRANRLVLFPQSLAALHGVSPRAVTPATRRYVFITAEIGEDWLTPCVS